MNEEEKKSSDLPRIQDDNQEDSKPLKKSQIDKIPDIASNEVSKKRARGKSVT